MSERLPTLQDQFLNGVRRSKSPVTVYLMKGVKLQGVVTWFDAFCLLLRRDGNSQLVYKHAISTILPANGNGGEALTFEHAPMASSLQDRFLAAAARDGGAVTLYLVNGVMLEGSVRAFDQFSLLLERSSQVQLVYKHAISTLQPLHSLDLDPQAGDER